MITLQTALRIVQPLATMVASFGQAWDPAVYAAVVGAAARDEQTARQAIADLVAGGSERPAPSDVKAAILALESDKPSAPACQHCNGVGAVPQLVLVTVIDDRTRQCCYKKREVFTAEHCLAAQGGADSYLAMLLHQRKLQRTCEHNQNVYIENRPCVCRKPAEKAGG